MADFVYQDMLPLGPDDTPYRLLTTDDVSTFEAAGHTFLQVEPEALTLLTREAMRDIAHLFRPGHLAAAGRHPRRPRGLRTTTASSPSSC